MVHQSNSSQLCISREGQRQGQGERPRIHSAGRPPPARLPAGPPPAPATPPPLVIKASGKIAELERRAYEELAERQVGWAGGR